MPTLEFHDILLSQTPGVAKLEVSLMLSQELEQPLFPRPQTAPFCVSWFGAVQT
jgi:hypothetical protein